MKPRLLEHAPSGMPIVDSPPGFVVTHLSCLKCGSRIEIDGSESKNLFAWVLYHAPHINDENGPWSQTYRPVWNSESWRKWR